MTKLNIKNLRNVKSNIQYSSNALRKYSVMEDYMKYDTPYEIWVARFEFVTKEGNVNIQQNENSKVVMWELALVSDAVDGGNIKGETIDEFLLQIASMKNAVILFHNLKFYYSFIQRALFGYGLEYVTDEELKIYDEENEFHNYWYEHSFKFHELISGTNMNVYSVDIAFPGSHVKLQDSSKLYTYTIDEIADALNVDYPEYDYSHYVYSDTKDFIPTEEDWEQLHNTIKVQQQLLIYHQNRYGRKKKYNAIPLTRAALAFSELRKAYDKSQGFVRTPFNEDAVSPFDKHFPATSTENGDFGKFAPAFYGGMVLLNPMYEQVLIDQPVWAYDVNSEFPYQMATKPLPVCEVKERKVFGETVESQYSATRINKPISNKLIKRFINTDELFIISIKFKGFTIKTDKNGNPGIPTYPKNVGRYATSKNIYSDLDLVMGTTSGIFSNIDLRMILDSYDFEELRIVDVYAFDSEIGPFKSFVEKQMEEKEEGRKMVSDEEMTVLNGGTPNKHVIAKGTFMSMNAKATVNSSYGTFGRYPYDREIVPTIELDPESDLGYLINYEEGERKILNTNCLFVSIFISAWARYMLWQGIKSVGWNKVAYCDTDSIHTVVEAKRLRLHPTELGAWSVDKFSAAYFHRTKIYAERYLDEDYEVMKRNQKTGQHVTHLDMKMAGFKSDMVDCLINDIEDFEYVCRTNFALPTLVNLTMNGQSVIRVVPKRVDAM